MSCHWSDLLGWFYPARWTRWNMTAATNHIPPSHLWSDPERRIFLAVCYQNLMPHWIWRWHWDRKLLCNIIRRTMGDDEMAKIQQINFVCVFSQEKYIFSKKIWFKQDQHREQTGHFLQCANDSFSSWNQQGRCHCWMCHYQWENESKCDWHKIVQSYESHSSDCLVSITTQQATHT